MGSTTTIHWTDASWDPITGCSKVSSGCLNCYAERLSLQKGRSPILAALDGAAGGTPLEE